MRSEMNKAKDEKQRQNSMKIIFKPKVNMWKFRSIETENGIFTIKTLEKKQCLKNHFVKTFSFFFKQILDWKRKIIREK